MAFTNPFSIIFLLTSLILRIEAVPSGSGEPHPEEPVFFVDVGKAQPLKFPYDVYHPILEIRAATMRRANFLESRPFKLEYNGHTLEDGYNLSDYGITENATIKMEYDYDPKFKIIVVVNSSPPAEIPFYVRRTQTIASLGDIFRKKYRIETNENSFHHDGKPQSPKLSLKFFNPGFCNPGEDATKLSLHISDTSKTLSPIHVTYHGGTELLFMQLKDKVERLKEMVSERKVEIYGVRFAKHRFLRNNIELEDDQKTLAEYGVKPNSTIQLIPN